MTAAIAILARAVTDALIIRDPSAATILARYSRTPLRKRVHTLLIAQPGVRYVKQLFHSLRSSPIFRETLANPRSMPVIVRRRGVICECGELRRMGELHCCDQRCKYNAISVFLGQIHLTFFSAVQRRQLSSLLLLHRRPLILLRQWRRQLRVPVLLLHLLVLLARVVHGYYRDAGAYLLLDLGFYGSIGLLHGFG